MKKTIVPFLFLSFLMMDGLFAGNKKFPTQSDFIYDIRFTSGGHALAIADGNTIKVYAFEEGKLLREFSGGHTKQIMAIALSSDSTLLISGDRGGKLVIWDMETGQQMSEMQAHDDIILSLDISHDGLYFASGGADNKVNLYDMQRKEIIRSYTNHSDDVMVVRFQPGGAILASGSADSKIILYNTVSSEVIQELTKHTSWVRDLAFSPNGNTLTAVGDDRQVATWDTTDPKNIKPRGASKLLRGWNTSIDYFKDNESIALGSINGRVHIQAPVAKMTCNVRKPIIKVLLWTNDGVTLFAVVATHGGGVQVIPASEMKVN